MMLDNSQPIVIGDLSNRIRITVFDNEVIDEGTGLSACIRIVNPKNLSKDDFINNQTATEEVLNFLSICLRYGLSMCITGEQVQERLHL